MKKIILGILAIIITIMIIIIQSNVKIEISETKNIQPIKHKLEMSKDYTIGLEKLNIITNISKKVFENHDYIINVYDCTEFSNDIVKNLTKLGIKSKCEFGFYKREIENKFNKYKKIPHTWVKIYDEDTGIMHVEGTSGQIISDEEYRKRYMKIGEGLCW